MTLSYHRRRTMRFVHREVFAIRCQKCGRTVSVRSEYRCSPWRGSWFCWTWTRLCLCSGWKMGLTSGRRNGLIKGWKGCTVAGIHSWLLNNISHPLLLLPISSKIDEGMKGGRNKIAQEQTFLLPSRYYVTPVVWIDSRVNELFWEVKKELWHVWIQIFFTVVLIFRINRKDRVTEFNFICGIYILFWNFRLL